MRTLIITILTIISCQLLYSQVKTEAYFGQADRDEWARDILELYDKGYYISGGFEGDPFHFGWNIKTDVNLEMIYDKVFEHSSYSIGQFLSVSDENGNIYVSGYATFAGGWPFVTKIDSCGNKVWCKILKYENEFEDGWANDIIYTNNSEIVLLTYFDSEEEIETVHLTALSENGDVLWNNGYASKIDYSWINEALGYSVEMINNEYYISGFCYWPYPDDTNHVFLRPLFIGIDSLFEEKWILPFAPLDSVFGDAFKTLPLNDSVFMGVGIRRAYNASNEDNALLMFYNNDGEELGYNEIYNDQIGPNIKGSDIRNIVRINNNLFMTASQFGSDFSANPTGELIIDTSAYVYNSQSHPNTLDFIPGLIKTYDNNYVIATDFKETNGDWDISVYKIDENLNDVPFDPTPHNYDSLCPGGIQSGTTDLTDCFIWTDISEAPLPGEFYASVKKIPVAVYPNPSNTGQVNFAFQNTKYHYNMEVRCFNVFGELVHKEKVYRHQEECKVNTSAWQKGMFVAVVYSDGLPVGECKFVVQ